MSDWKQRLTGNLEPALQQQDPRPHISAYHDMPFAMFCYPETEELPLRQELELLKTRLEGAGKRVTVVSLAECLEECLQRQDLTPADLAQAEKAVGLEATVDTIHQILAELEPLDRIVAGRIPPGDPTRDLVFLVRAGALFPVYRTSSLLENLMGQVELPMILFYPGTRDGAAGLRFMSVLDPEHNYRARIF